MNPARLVSDGWSWNALALFVIAVAAASFAIAFGRKARWGCFAGALAVLVFALMSPLNAIAERVLFSAHMTQHILLLLIVPGLLVLAIPRDFSPRFPGRVVRALPFVGWGAGIGSMWFWHLPAMCDAAATLTPVRALQSLSLIALGAVFWWPILAPQARDRLRPGHGVAYLFTACLGCTALGIILTLTPIQVCSVYAAPLASPGPWAALREAITPERDRQIGGLLMWIPMCSIYVAAIMFELRRWFGESRGIPEVQA